MAKAAATIATLFLAVGGAGSAGSRIHYFRRGRHHRPITDLDGLLQPTTALFRDPSAPACARTIVVQCSLTRKGLARTKRTTTSTYCTSRVDETTRQRYLNETYYYLGWTNVRPLCAFLGKKREAQEGRPDERLLVVLPTGVHACTMLHRRIPLGLWLRTVPPCSVLRL
jgi:hypothetical protein